MAEAIGRREQKKLLGKQKIVAAAISRFSSQGYRMTTVADIMQEAEMGLGTFYNYFASKDELLHFLLDEFAASLEQHLQKLQATKERQADILREMLMLMAELIGKNKYVLPLFLQAGNQAENIADAKEGTEHRNHVPAFIDMFLHLVEAGQQSGEFRQDVSAEIITETFHSLFQAAAFSSLPLSFEENIKMKLKLMTDGLCIKQ